MIPEAGQGRIDRPPAREDQVRLPGALGRRFLSPNRVPRIPAIGSESVA